LGDVVDHRFERSDDRLGRLEADVKEIKADIKGLDQRAGGEIKGLDQRMGGIEQRLARLEGMISNLPSTWVMLTAIAASQVTLLGFTFPILRYAPR
jgi:hypothetical protein